MKNIRISPKFIELVKTNSRRLLCGVITFIALAIPHTGKTEIKSEDIQVNERIVEQLNYYNTEEVEFIVDGESVKVTGKISKSLTTTNGIAKFKIYQATGTYKITISALGKSVTKTITVKHLVTLKAVTVKK